ncbi:MAG TPA: cytochrome c oxidase assembly protein, partial [Acidimicrobiales bacterium]|nr:cytochrome c oxidase assembly protein [Acidimicrobiales bacterium]
LRTPQGGPGMTGAASPWTFHLHPGALGVIALLGGLYALVIRRRARIDGSGAMPTRAQRFWLAGALGSLTVALWWPVADLAAHWSITALMAQRLLLVLAVAPMLLLAVPVPILAALTRPAPIDATLDFVSRPAVAIAVFSVVIMGTLLTPAVAAQASDPFVRGATDALVVVAGMILWAPALAGLPGARHPAALALAVYLFFQSIVPTFIPAVVFVFSRHVLYPAYAHSHLAVGLAPVNDQQLAGMLVKVATIPVLWTVAWIALTRAEHHRAEGGDEDDRTLTWAEVQRQLERAERAERAAAASRRARTGAGPATPAGGTAEP